MQLASYGARALKPTGGGTLLHTNHTRSIHIPSIPRPNVGQPTSTAQAVFKQTRHLFSRFVAHLTTPGISRLPGSVPATGRSLYNGPTQMRSIQQGLSSSARFTLSRPLQLPRLPKAPAVPRGVSQVGLGLARNFSTGRPVFQNLVENVPITGRALWEADWDTRMRKEQEKMRMRKSVKGKQSKKSKEMLRPRETKKATKVVTAVEEREADLEHYFPAAPLENPEVTTHLLIPLAPVVASAREPRLPLSASPANHPLLPVQVLANMHGAHTTHSLRVSSLFARLDASRVFESPHVKCEAHGDPLGLATLLEVTFDGWDEKRVRSVLGEAGQGWCTVEEVWKDRDAEERQAMDEALETMSTSEESVHSDWHVGVQIDPAHSMVLPTLDFSASFPVAFPSPAQAASPAALSRQPSDLSMSDTLSDFAFHNAWAAAHPPPPDDARSDSDKLSDVASESSWVETMYQPDLAAAHAHAPASERSWFGFSSEFMGRMGQEAEGPREDMF
ncbi:uncharacterized protein B0H18DRAFT_1114803 [Fomitopsis serialis]|uniref:uncharacterized protein n=1 Tax=Fomitopsis serialis TaxID=139415 RepID=UPI002007C42D|nr:uncharacterized protein B0H18DRAFT_1114803 [Neoantrodia serialis]KAH9934983.1 hypothetical protein B0H18DRAFT_1114803 [Neoantrodia serialis]